MEPMGKKKARGTGRLPRRAFTPEFKAEIVNLVQHGGRSIPHVVRDVDLTDSAARNWITQAERDNGTRTEGLASDEKADFAALRQDDHRRVRMSI